MSDAYGIIAGAGSFPLHVAREMTRRGLTVAAIGLRGWVDEALAAHVSAYDEVSVGQLGRMIETLKARRVSQAVMAGKVTKEVLFDPRVEFDAEALDVLRSTTEFSVNRLLGAIADRLLAHGITLLDSSTFLKDNLCRTGVLTTTAPTAEQQQDIRMGVAAARQMAAMDIGQTIVVRRAVIVAVEALEGTDATIRRAGEIAGPGCVIVKMASPSQDRRFDLPVLGPSTITSAASARASCLAVEAGSTLLLDPQALLAQAEQTGLCLVGIDPAALS